MKINKAISLALLCVLTWSAIPVISKVTTSVITPLQMLFLSNTLSSLAIGFILILSRKKIDNISQQIKDNLFKTVFPGFLGCYFYYLCLYYGYSKADGVLVLVVQYLWPVLIVLLAPFITGEQLIIRRIYAALLGLFGVIVVATKGAFVTFDPQSLPILGIVFVGALAVALFSLLSKKIDCHSLVATFLYFSWAALFSLITVLISSEIAIPKSVNALVGLIINGVVVNGISYYWWIRALQMEDSTRIAPLIFLTPVLACLWLVLFLNEPFFISYIIGLCLCISAGILASRRA